jgi:hypothetical protein
VIRDSHVPGEDNVVPYSCTAGDPDPGHDQAALADPDIVTDLHEVVQLGATTDDGIVDASPIDASIRSHLDLVLQNTGTHMRDAGVPLTIRQVPKALTPDHGSCLEDDPMTNPGAGVADHSWAYPGIVSEDDSITDRY